MPALIQRVYDALLRPHLPRRLEVCNGVVVRSGRLLDVTDVRPDYEAALIDALRGQVQAGDHVVVVGGGFGVSAVVAAEQAGETGRVTVYEAGRAHAQLVEEAAQLNDVYDRVAVHHAVVGPAVEVFSTFDGACQVTPADLPACDVLELDCEGAELAVLRGLTVRPRAIVVECHPHLDVPESAVADRLGEFGYEITDRRVEPEHDDIVILTARTEVS